MTFPILGGNGAVAGYEIDNSLRFNDNDSARLSRTPSSSTNRKTWTWSSWIKLNPLATNYPPIFGADTSVPDTHIRINTTNNLNISLASGQAGGATLTTNRVFRDASAWYHIIVVIDTTNATADDRMKVYINGVEETSFSSRTNPTLNYDTKVNHTVIHQIGAQRYSSYWDGYMAEVHFIDGTAKAPTDFGEYDDSGIWKPKQYTGSYGTNGFYLDFENSGSLGADQSGNGNNFTPTNLASTDQTTDTPTNNFCTLNSIYRNGASSNIAPTYSEGNTITNSGGSGTSATRTSSTFEFSSGKWYWEVKVNDSPSAVDIGINNNDIGALCGIRQDGTYFTDNSNQGTLTSFTSGDIISFAFDMDNKKMYIAKNGTYMNSANPSTSTNGISFTTTDSMHCQFKSRQDDSLSANFGNPAFSISSGNSDGNGYGNFEYSVPSGYLALCTQNLATALSPTIDDGSQYFNTVLWSGDSTNDRDITGVGFQPDWVWIKERTSPSFISNHALFDSTRGGQKGLSSNTTDAEYTSTSQLQSFITDGFNVNDSGAVNGSGETYVAWNWIANGGTTSSNTDGSITSTVQANTTAGFSIVTYTGNATTGATVGHGLGVAPKIVLIKKRNSTSNWVMQNTNLNVASGNCLFLDTTDANTTISSYWNAVPSSTVFTLGNNSTPNGSGDTYVAYCFADIEGYSKMGSYTGNGNADGTFVYTGFRPTWFLAKRTSATSHWTMLDGTRNSFNVAENYLHANESNAENTNNQKADFLSNGIKLRSISRHNDSGSTFIYMAFASNPFVTSSGVPVVAR